MPKPKIHFAISSVPLKLDRDSRPNPRAGAVVIFEGRVRDHTKSQTVTELFYEAHRALAVSQGMKILRTAATRFKLHEASCAHRVGRLRPGELAVKITTASAHRTQAFQGCQYIIDEIKKHVPIWKKETFTNGRSTWAPNTWT